MVTMQSAPEALYASTPSWTFLIVGLGLISEYVLDVLDRGVGLDLGVELPGDARLVEKIGHLGHDAKLHEVGVGADKGLLVAAALELAGDLLDRAGAVVGDVVQDEAVDCHAVFPPWECACRNAGGPVGSIPLGSC